MSFCCLRCHTSHQRFLSITISSSPSRLTFSNDQQKARKMTRTIILIMLFMKMELRLIELNLELFLRIIVTQLTSRRAKKRSKELKAGDGKRKACQRIKFIGNASLTTQKRRDLSQFNSILSSFLCAVKIWQRWSLIEVERVSTRT